MCEHDGELYKVNDTTLYRIDSIGAATSVGTIAGSGRCVFATDGTNLIITTGSTGYQLTGTTLTTISDTDYQSANSVAYINQQMIFDGNGGKFQTSDVGNPDSIDGLNYATAESAPDDTIRVFVHREDVYIFGEKTVEPWYNTGSGNPPFARVRNGTMRVGLHAIHSVAGSEQYMYFLGSDKRVYRVSSLQPQNITNNAIAEQLDNIDCETAVGFIARLDGQTFYVLNCPTKTFAYSEESSAWFNLSSEANESRYIAEDYIELYGKRLISNGGSVSYLDKDTFTDNGEVRAQERIFGPILPSDLGIGASSAVMSRLWIHGETGVGTSTGQGQIPALIVNVSTDGGRSWTTERDVLMGRTGQHVDMKYDHLTTFRTLFIKVRCTDPVFVAIYGATLEVREGGI